MKTFKLLGLVAAFTFSSFSVAGIAANKQTADFLRLWQWRAQGNLVRLNQINRDGSHS